MWVEFSRFVGVGSGCFRFRGRENQAEDELEAWVIQLYTGCSA